MASLRRLSVILVLLTMFAGACGEGTTVPESTPSTSETSDGSTATTAASTSTTSAPTSTAGAGGPAFGTTTVSTPSGKQGLLASVQASAGDKVERVTFTFEGDVPPYRVGYVERPVVQDGSGDEIEVDGEAVLEVHFEPASGFDLSGEGRQVYKGPNRLGLATAAVKDVVRVGDFEASLVWAIGVEKQSPFRVRTDEPNKVVVEVEVPA